MALISLPALLVGGIITYLGIGFVSTLATLITVVASLFVTGYVIYNLIEGDLLPIESGFWRTVAAIPLGVLAGVGGFRTFELVFTALSYGLALVLVLLLVASVLFGPRFVGQVITGLAGIVTDIVGGE